MKDDPYTVAMKDTLWLEMGGRAYSMMAEENTEHWNTAGLVGVLRLRFGNGATR